MHSVALSIPGIAKLRLSCCTQDLLLVGQHHRFDSQDMGIHQEAESEQFEKRFKTWSLILRNSPALMAVAVDGYYRRFGRSPKNAKALIQYASSQLIGGLLKSKVLSDVRCSPKAAKAIRKASSAWLSARSNKASRRALVDFLLVSVPPNRRQTDDGHTIQSWVKQVFGKELANKRLGSCPGKKSAVRERLVNQPHSHKSIDIEVLRSMLSRAETAACLSNDFEGRLQNAKLAAMKQLAYGASHEINNPLANIATGAQVMLQSENDVDRRHRLARIYAQAMLAHEMISDLMLFANPPEPVFECTDLRLMIQALIHRRDPSGKQIQVTLGRNVGAATMDANQILVVLEALLRNATEAVDANLVQRCDKCAGPAIHLRVDQCDDRVQFRVTDHGTGMDGHVMEHLFDPFFSGREAGRGLGFGLSKAWRIVDLHGGKISAHRDARYGETTFSFWLPVNQNQAG